MRSSAESSATTACATRPTSTRGMGSTPKREPHGRGLASHWRNGPHDEKTAAAGKRHFGGLPSSRRESFLGPECGCKTARREAEDGVGAVLRVSERAPRHCGANPDGWAEPDIP